MSRWNRAATALAGTGVVLLALSGCGGSTAAPTATATAAAVAPSGGQPQQRGLGVTQLALGTLLLEDTDQAVTAEQAATLVPIWQQVQSLAGSESPAQDEMAGLEEQLRAAMAAEQLQAIQSTDQSSAEVQELLASLGISMPQGGPGFGGTPPAGGQAGQGTPPAGGQTPQGTPPAAGQDGEAPGGGVGPGGMGMIDETLLGEVVELLQQRAAGS